MVKRCLRLRLSVFRANKHIYAQIINDESRKTLVAASDKNLEKTAKKQTKREIAFSVGELLAKKAKLSKVNKIYLDKGKYKYHGQIKALAEGARKGGLDF